MIGIRHIAAPLFLGAAMLVGVAGCASDSRGDIPINAREIGSGRETVSYTAPGDGTIYIKDDSTHKMVYTGKVERGQMVKLDAKENKVLIDNRTVTEADLVNDHKFIMFFEGMDPQKMERTEKTTITREPASIDDRTVIKKETTVQESK